MSHSLYHGHFTPYKDSSADKFSSNRYQSTLIYYLVYYDHISIHLVKVFYCFSNGFLTS